MIEGSAAGISTRQNMPTLDTPNARPARISDRSTVFTPVQVLSMTVSATSYIRIEVIASSVSPNQIIDSGNIAVPGIANKKFIGAISIRSQILK